MARDWRRLVPQADAQIIEQVANLLLATAARADELPLTEQQREILAHVAKTKAGESLNCTARNKTWFRFPAPLDNDAIARFRYGVLVGQRAAATLIERTSEIAVARVQRMEVDYSAVEFPVPEFAGIPRLRAAIEQRAWIRD